MTELERLRLKSTLREAMQDPRYRHPLRRDPFFVHQVEEGFRKLTAAEEVARKVAR